MDQSYKIKQEKLPFYWHLFYNFPHYLFSLVTFFCFHFRRFFLSSFLVTANTVIAALGSKYYCPHSVKTDFISRADGHSDFWTKPLLLEFCWYEIFLYFPDLTSTYSLTLPHFLIRLTSCMKWLGQSALFVSWHISQESNQHAARTGYHPSCPGQNGAGRGGLQAGVANTGTWNSEKDHEMGHKAAKRKLVVDPE